MGLHRMKPTSPGRRAMVKQSRKELHSGRPYVALTEKIKKHSGRNNLGRITTRHVGGGQRKAYRLIDFKRNFDDVPAIVERLEYDPNRSANIALLRYPWGVRSYVVATLGMKVGAAVMNGQAAPVKPGNAMPMRNIPLGTVICCIEMFPGKGAQVARSAGAFATLVATEGDYAQVRLRSGEVRKFHLSGRATIGQVGNVENSLCKLGKAGVKRWCGVRPTVRGVAMNPVDHPHGGGEGRTSGGRHPVTPWGVQTKGKKTRTNERTSAMIISRRKKGR